MTGPPPQAKAAKAQAKTQAKTQAKAAAAAADLLAAKREPGAYLSREGKLYEVLRFDEKGRWLLVINSQTENEVRLTGAQTLDAELVRAAPVCPRRLPA